MTIWWQYFPSLFCGTILFSFSIINAGLHFFSHQCCVISHSMENWEYNLEFSPQSLPGNAVQDSYNRYIFSYSKTIFFYCCNAYQYSTRGISSAWLRFNISINFWSCINHFSQIWPLKKMHIVPSSLEDCIAVHNCILLNRKIFRCKQDIPCVERVKVKEGKQRQ